MLKKCGKFMADWRDANGTRHRKAFDTQREAIDHADKMRAATHPGAPTLPNQSAQRPRLRKPLRSTPPRNRKTRTPKRRSRT